MIRPTDVGKRVSVQYFDDDGAKREAVGVLERVERSADRLVYCIRKRDESLARVPAARLRFAKVLPPR